MKLEESMRAGGFKVFCPGTNEIISIDEYIDIYIEHDRLTVLEEELQKLKEYIEIRSQF